MNYHTHDIQETSWAIGMIAVGLAGSVLLFYRLAERFCGLVVQEMEQLLAIF